MELRELQLFELEILKEMDRICKENNLRYFLACGTLLGAVRHKGFIPWDDDIDVYMPFDDYMKFEEACKKSMSDKFYFQSREVNPQNYIYWNRIGVKNSTSIDLSLANIHMQWGICIDIFPLFPYAKDKNEKEKRRKLYKRMELLSLKYLHTKTASMASGMTKIKKMAHNLIPDALNIKLFLSCVNQLGEENEYTQEYCMDYEFSHVCDGFKKEWFQDVVELDYEGMKFPAPVGYHEYLTCVYGDYMKVPDENNRGKHSDNPNIYISFNEPYTKFLKGE